MESESHPVSCLSRSMACLRATSVKKVLILWPAMLRLCAMSFHPLKRSESFPSILGWSLLNILSHSLTSCTKLVAGTRSCFLLGIASALLTSVEGMKVMIAPVPEILIACSNSGREWWVNQRMRVTRSLRQTARAYATSVSVRCWELKEGFNGICLSSH